MGSSSAMLHYAFTVCGVLQGACLFIVHCYMSKDSRKEAKHTVNRIADKVTAASKQFDLTAEKTLSQPHCQLQNAASLASVVSSDLSVGSMEMRRLSPLGASDTNISQAPVPGVVSAPIPQSSLVIVNNALFGSSPLSSNSSQLSEVDIDEAVNQHTTHIDIDEAIRRRSATLAPQRTVPAARTPQAQLSATSSPKVQKKLRGALKKASGSRSGSLKRLRKKSVSWKLQSDHTVNDNAAVDSGDDAHQKQPKHQTPSSLGGRRAQRQKLQGNDSNMKQPTARSFGSANSHSNGVSTKDKPPKQYPDKYTIHNSWSGHGKLPVLTKLSADKRSPKADGSAASGQPLPPQRTPPTLRTKPNKGRRTSANGLGGLAGWQANSNGSTGQNGASATAAPHHRRRVSPLPVSIMKRLSVTSDLEVPNSGLSTPAGTATPGLHWNVSRSPEPSVLENSDDSCSSMAPSGDEDASGSSDTCNDTISSASGQGSLRPTPLSDSILAPAENGDATTASAAATAAAQNWAFGQSVVERLQSHPVVDDVFGETTSEATITPDLQLTKGDTVNGSQGAGNRSGADWRYHTTCIDTEL